VQPDDYISVEPYKHDCKSCKWVGWISCTKRLGNMYFCPKCDGGTVIIRFSDDPGDYWSSPIMGEPHSCAVPKEVMQDATR
jgi:hypothetical protein